MLKKLFALFLLLGLFGVSAGAIGCEARGEIDDDGVELDVDD